MGSYLNPGCDMFRRSLNSDIYVDKSELIAETNRHLFKENCFMCVSRPRRFGKSMAVNMLAAYYGCEEDAHPLFDKLIISGCPTYAEHLNKYNVIQINMTMFLRADYTIQQSLEKLQRYLKMDLLEDYGNIRYRDPEDLIQMMTDVYLQTKCPFVILIDEWDCLFREYKDDDVSQRVYLDFLRRWLKDQRYIALVYMTGILPVKKYGTHSALNMFTEYSMTEPRELAPYFGFTEEEVSTLCDTFGMSFEQAKAWYDGYELTTQIAVNPKTISIYSPKSVVESMLAKNYGTYWNQTETFEALRIYIRMNFDGLKESVVKMMMGESVSVDISGFSNDMKTFASADDVLTLLIHLGYLKYNAIEKTVAIPNYEVTEEYVTAVRNTREMGEVARSLEVSRKLLEALWRLDAKTVAATMDEAHQETSILTYNDENSLACVVTLAFYYAREYYMIIRELPAGKGFADICLIPKPMHIDKPAVVIELKKDKSARGAIDQIKDRQYVHALDGYQGNLLLCGINYDKNKKHACLIEKWTMAD